MKVKEIAYVCIQDYYKKLGPNDEVNDIQSTLQLIKEKYTVTKYLTLKYFEMYLKGKLPMHSMMEVILRNIYKLKPGEIENECKILGYPFYTTPLSLGCGCRGRNYAQVNAVRCRTKWNFEVRKAFISSKFLHDILEDKGLVKNEYQYTQFRSMMNGYTKMTEYWLKPLCSIFNISEPLGWMMCENDQTMPEEKVIEGKYENNPTKRKFEKKPKEKLEVTHSEESVVADVTESDPEPCADYSKSVWDPANDEWRAWAIRNGCNDFEKSIIKGNKWYKAKYQPVEVEVKKMQEEHKVSDEEIARRKKVILKALDILYGEMDRREYHTICNILNENYKKEVQADVCE